MLSEAGNKLIANILLKTELSPEEQEMVVNAFQPSYIKKKKDLLRNGEVCRYIFFVSQGCLRSYSIDEKGHEHIYQLAFENYWITDLYSFFTESPSNLSIEAIEDTHMLMISFEKLENLYLKVPRLERFFRKLFQNAYIHTLERLNRTINETAEKRYNELITKHPDLLQRVPLIHIAAYLGIKPESLSRIRRQK